MIQEHLTEKELQQMALEPQESDLERAMHVSECASCATAVANYRAMFLACATIEKPVFHFNLEKQVMAVLPVTTTRKTSLLRSMLGLSVIAIVAGVIPVWILNHYFIQWFSEVSGPVLYLLVTTPLAIVLFQCREMLVTYREKECLLHYY